MLPPSSSRTICTTLSAASGPGLRASIISQASAPAAASAPSRTKVRNPLTLESSDRRGLRGGFGGGLAGIVRRGLDRRGRTGLPAAGAASPSPESSSPLMSPAASARARRRPILHAQSRAGLNAPRRGTSDLADGQCGETTNCSAAAAVSESARKTSDALVPPNPNELDSAAWIGRLRATCGARSIAVSTRGCRD